MNESNLTMLYDTDGCRMFLINEAGQRVGPGRASSSAAEYDQAILTVDRESWDTTSDRRTWDSVPLANVLPVRPPFGQAYVGIHAEASRRFGEKLGWPASTCPGNLLPMGDMMSHGAVVPLRLLNHRCEACGHLVTVGVRPDSSRLYSYYDAPDAQWDGMAMEAMG